MMRKTLMQAFGIGEREVVTEAADCFAQQPVVPSSTTWLIAVVGVDALGMPLDSDHIHAV
jgi:hypothetical protein